MKATELINKLREYINKYGDLEVTSPQYSCEEGDYQDDIDEIEVVEKYQGHNVFSIY